MVTTVPVRLETVNSIVYKTMRDGAGNVPGGGWGVERALRTAVVPQRSRGVHTTTAPAVAPPLKNATLDKTLVGDKHSHRGLQIP